MIQLKQSLLVAVGGAIGAVSRYAVGSAILSRASESRFPVATLTVNIAGCLVAGLLTGFMDKRDYFTSDVRLFLFVGLLGGFTTFSAFSLETIGLLRRGELPVAVAYVLASVLGGLLSFAVGMKLFQS